MNSCELTDAWAGLLEDPDVCEVGGEHTNEGIDYARYLAMVLLVEMEEVGLPDYALLFEYLQDIAIIDSPTAPTKATLLQVKKKSKGNWSKALLCKKETANPNEDKTENGAPDSGALEQKDKPNSFVKKQSTKKLSACSPLGKLYLSVQKLSTVVATNGVFISNAWSDLKSVNGNPLPLYSQSKIQHLHSEDLEYIRKKLCSELKQETLSHLSHLAVEQSRVIPASMREAVRGLLDEMLARKYPTLPNISGQLQEKLLAAFSALSAPPGKINSLQEVLEKKGYSRSDFSNLVSTFASIRTAADQLDSVINGLKQEGMPPRLADRLRTEAGRLQIQLVREPQIREILLWDVAITEARKCTDTDEYKSAIDKITAEIKTQANARAHGPTSDRETQAVALLALIHVDQELTSPGSQSSDQIQ